MPGSAPEFRFTTTTDGVSIAHATFGSGPPLVVPPGWVSHLERVFDDHHGQFFQRLAQTHTVTTYDGRGTGLSDRNAPDLSVMARLRDLEAVVEQSQPDPFSLFAWSQSTPAAMVYAAEHPERIERLLLFAAMCGGNRPPDGETGVLRPLLDLMRAEWGVGARATMGFVHPDADNVEMKRELEFLRAASSGDVAARILEEGFLHTDVREYLPRIQAPTLVMHRRGDKAVGQESGRIVASLIPGSRFVLLEGDHHLPYDHDAEPVLRTMEEFLGVEPRPKRAMAPSWPAPPAAPITIMFTDIEGSTTLTQRLGDAGAQDLLRAHDSIVRDELRRLGGAEIKHTGDGIMASFPAPSRALECAITIQRAMVEHNAEDQAGAPINVRIGINVGEPVQEGSDLFGVAVQLARRICDQADPGQILVSNVVRELVAGKGFLFADRGEAALRGFEDAVRLYEVAWASES